MAQFRHVVATDDDSLDMGADHQSMPASSVGPLHEPVSKGGLRNKIERAAMVTVGTSIVLSGPGLAIATILSRTPLAEVDVPWVLIVADVVAGLLCVIYFAVATFEMRRSSGTRDIPLSIFVGVLGISGPAHLLASQSSTVGNLAARGTTVTLDPQQSTLTLGSLGAKFLWEGLDVIPLLDVPSTLGWEDPVPDPAAPLGWMLLATRALLALVVTSAVYRFFRTLAGQRASMPPQRGLESSRR